MTNVVNGIKTFLGFMDPSLDEVGMTVFPPALDQSSVCKTPTAGAEQLRLQRVVAELGSERLEGGDAEPLRGRLTRLQYLTQTSGGWALNGQSWLVQS